VSRIHQFVTENLLCTVACVFAVGISVSSNLQGLPLQIFFLTLSGALTAFFFHYHWTKSATTMVLIFFTGLGILFGNNCYKPPADPAHIYHLVKEKREAVVIGILDGLQGYDGQMSRAEINCESIRFKDENDFIPVTGRINLGLKEVWPKDIVPGDKIVIRAHLSRPQTLRTAGSFNYVHFLAEKDIWITGVTESSLFLYKIDMAPSLFHTLRYTAERARMRIGAAFDDALSPQLAGIYKAVVIGEWSGMSNDLLEKFKATGCMHILSISGTHMSIIWVFLFTIIYWLLKRSEWLILHCDIKKTAALVCLLPLCFYALLAGSNTPVMRSMIMSIVVIAALCVNRKKSIFATLSLALLCLLAWRPSNLFNVSFQLTFAAVASIAAIFPFLSHLLFPGETEEKGTPSVPVRLRNWLIAALAVSVSATIGTAPILLFSFNRISLVGPLANLVVEPLICFLSLTSGFLAIPCVFLFPDLASLLLRLGAWGLKASIASVTFFNEFPLASVWLPTPSPFLIMIYYVSLFLILTGLKHHKSIYWTACLVFPATLLFFVLPPSELFKYIKENSTITFIDVGQGSAVLLELPGGKRALVDGGGPTSPKFNTGEKVIGPFLWKKGITKIDSVIITHPDADHYNGVPFILEHFRPESLWINGSAGHDQGYADLLDLARKREIPLRTPVGDELLLKAGKAEISVIENPVVKTGGSEDHVTSARDDLNSINDSGLIVRFTDGRLTAVLPGDISKRVEALLLNNPPERLKSQVLLSPHHGSSTSNSAAFLEMVHPEYLIVSAGYAHDGVFPARGLAGKAGAYGIKMLTTAQVGCIVVSSNSRGFSVATGNGISMEKQIPRNP
jgi:competence protein ComEC